MTLVLDDQLDRSVREHLARRYPRVHFLRDLRPGTIIKDDAVPKLLRERRQCLFLTINQKHFWDVVEAHPRYSIVCFSLPDEKQGRIPDLLSRLFKVPGFHSTNERSGKVARLSTTSVTFYTRLAGNRHTLSLP